MTIYLPTDNLDPRTISGFTGVQLPSGTIIGNGEYARVKMTTSGGKPAPGANVWLASSDEDGATQGQLPINASYRGGYFTATKPILLVPTYPKMRNNLSSIVGTVIDNSRYDIDKTVIIRVITPATVQYVNNSGTSTNPADVEQIFRGIRCPIGSSYTIAATGQTTLGNNETLIINFIVDNVTSIPNLNGTGWRIYNDSTNHGWLCYLTDSCSILNFNYFEPNGTVHVGALGAQVAPGKNSIVIWRAGGFFHIAQGALRRLIATIPDTNADAVVSPTFTIDFSHGVTTSIIKLASAPSSDNAALDIANGITDPAGVKWFSEGSDPYAADVTVVTDPNCQWYLNPTSTTLTTTAGAAGSQFTFTKNGNPVYREMTLHWYHSLAPFVQDSYPAIYDSRHSIRTSMFSRIRYTVANQYEWAMTTQMIVQESLDNNDEAASTQYVSNSSVTHLPATYVFTGYGFPGDDSTDTQAKNGAWELRGSDNSFWVQWGSGGPYTVDIEPVSQTQRFDIFADAGWLRRIGILNKITENGVDRATGAIEADHTTSNRLMIVADEITLGGRQKDFFGESPGAYSPISVMRQTFAGKITCETWTPLSWEWATAWGNGDVTKFMEYVYNTAHLNNAGGARLRYLIVMGISDWNTGRVTAALTGTRMATGVDFLHALDPGVPIYFAPPPNTPIYGSSNGHETLQAFIDAEMAVWSSRSSWLTKLDLTGPNVLTWDPDGLHLSSIASQANMAANVLGGLGP